MLKIFKARFAICEIRDIFLQFEIVLRSQIKKLWMQLAETFYFQAQVTWTQCWSFSAGGRPLTIMWLSLTQFICERKWDRSAFLTLVYEAGRWENRDFHFEEAKKTRFSSFNPCLVHWVFAQAVVQHLVVRVQHLHHLQTGKNFKLSFKTFFVGSFS